MAILAQTTVVQGYAKDSFDIAVSIDPMFFGVAPQGATPLIGVRVDFRTRKEPVVLTPQQPSVTVTLPMPLLLFVTNATDAQHYSYAVTNLHAGGSRGPRPPSPRARGTSRSSRRRCSPGTVG